MRNSWGFAGEEASNNNNNNRQKRLTTSADQPMTVIRIKYKWQDTQTVHDKHRVCHSARRWQWGRRKRRFFFYHYIFQTFINKANKQSQSYCTVTCSSLPHWLSMNTEIDDLELSWMYRVNGQKNGTVFKSWYFCGGWCYKCVWCVKILANCTQKKNIKLGCQCILCLICVNILCPWNNAEYRMILLNLYSECSDRDAGRCVWKGDKRDMCHPEISMQKNMFFLANIVAIVISII